MLCCNLRLLGTLTHQKSWHMKTNLRLTLWYWRLTVVVLLLTCASRPGRSQSVQPASVSVGSIAAGEYFTLLLKPDGSLWSSGNNFSGGLGRTMNFGTALPTPTPGLVITPPTAAAGTYWTQVVAGGATVLALRSDGTLWQWGLSLGAGMSNPTAYVPTQVPLPVGVPAGSTWTGISTSGFHALAVCSNGSLWAWGWNAFGQLGNGQQTDTRLLQRVQEPNRGSRWVAAWAGSRHSLGLRDDGSLWAWGSNSCGALGVPVTGGPLYAVIQPVLVPTPAGAGPNTVWVGATPGESHSLAIRSDGTMWGWGNGYNRMPTATQVVNPRNTTWQQVSTHNVHTLGVGSDGAIWGWGWFNERGILGTNSTADVYPMRQEATQGRWLQVAVGSEHSVAMSAAGEVWATGAYYPAGTQNLNFGQFGDGTTLGSLIFRRVQTTALSTATATASGPRLWPNPAAAAVQVSGLKAYTSLVLYALDGRIVRSYKPEGSAARTLDIQGLSAGLYLLHAQAVGEPVCVARLLVE